MIVLTPATRFAATPNRITISRENPNTVAAMMAPNVNTPASPSRNTALASRNQNVARASRKIRAMSCTSTT